MATLIRPRAVSGAHSSLPSPRPSRFRGPMALARISGRTSSQAGSPPCAWTVRCRCGASPRMVMPPTRPAIRRCCRRSPHASRRMGCTRARISTWQRRPWGPTTVSRPSATPCSSPADPPPTAQADGSLRRRWPTTTGRWSGCWPRRPRQSPVRGPFIESPRGRAPDTAKPIGLGWSTPAARSNAGSSTWRVRAGRHRRR
jgi:hypothetical protein